MMRCIFQRKVGDRESLLLAAAKSTGKVQLKERLGVFYPDVIEELLRHLRVGGKRKLAGFKNNLEARAFRM